MANLTDRDIRLIQEIHSAVMGMSSMLRDVRNSQSNSQITSAIHDARGMVDSMRSDVARMAMILNNFTMGNTSFNLTQMQQFLMRIDANTQGSVSTVHIDQVRNDVANLQVALSNMEQFMNDVSAYIHDIQNRLSALQESGQPPHTQQGASA